MEEWLVREVFLEKEDLVWFLKHVQELARWRWAHVSRSRGCSGDWIHMGHHQLHAGNISWHPTSCLCLRPLAFHSGLPWWQRVWEVVEPHSVYTNTPLQGKAHAPYGVDLQPERRADGCVFIPLSPGSKTLRRLFSGFSEEPCEVRQSGALHALHLCVARLFLASLPVSLTSALWSCHP